MNNVKINKLGFLLIILLLGYFLVFWYFSVVVRFFLAMWLISVTEHFFRKVPIEIELNPENMKTFTLDEESTTEAVISNMRNDGFRPATLAEVLIWVRAKPEKMYGKKLVALGSSRVVDKICSVPAVDMYENNSPYFKFDPAGSEWEKDYYFLGVCQ